jgi:pimeloyl-ACP methyl ester carboxylesterase
VLYGQSIGGAVAIDLASRNPDAVRARRMLHTHTFN